MERRLVFAFVALLACCCRAGFSAPASGSLPNFDIQAGVRGTTRTTPPAAAALAMTPTALRGVTIRYDALTGTASRILRPGGTVTGPSRLTPEQNARSFFLGHPELFRQTSADAAYLYVPRRYASPHGGMQHVWLGQQFRGIPVFKSETAFHLGAQGEILSVSGSPVPNLPQTILASTPRLSQAQALAKAAQYAGMAPQQLAGPVSAPAGTRRAMTFGTGAAFSRPPLVQLTYFPVGSGRTALTWDTTLWQTRTTDVYHILVDASTGQLLFRKNYTSHASGQVYDQDSPQDGTPYTGSVPAVSPRVVKPFDGSDTFDGTALFPNGNVHFDWWNGAAATSTIGTNVHAGAARGGVEGSITPANAGSGVFNFTLDLAQDPSTYQDAASTNLFYWNNRLHDIWYQFGFDEAAGNFQNANFSLGGSGGDPVIAHCQFGADTGFENNADFATPPDGQSGIMRMFVFTITNPQRDGDIENGVISHEYGHGVTNRLVGNGNGLLGFQGGAMGEGWSDFQALMVLAQPGDDVNGKYPIGGWVLNDWANGVRSQPYSVNPSVFTHTYADIAGFSGFPEVHDAGEIMANTLWQTYVKFVNRLGFSPGRRRMMQLFIDALKITPDDPTFLDFRDAMLTADGATNGGADQSDIWSAFASRGMGFSASTSGPNDVNPVEAFDLPPQSHSISGSVTKAGVGVAGATVHLTGASSATTSTNGSGAYTFANLAAGNYTVSADVAGEDVTPLSRSVLLTNSDATGVDFTVVLKYSISGTITSGGTGLSGVMVTAGGKNATTNGSGFYQITNLVAGDYTVSATKANYIFNPVDPEVTLGPDATVNFTGSPTFTISGTVKENGVGLAGVTVSAGGQNTSTDNNGAYSIGGLVAGSYAVTATKGGYDISTGTPNVTLGPDATVDFTAVQVSFNITGTVKLNGAGLSGVSVSTGGLNTSTDGNGAYSFVGLAAGNYTVTASKATYTITTGTPNVTLGPNAVVNFTATPSTFNITGTVKEGNTGVSGVTVSAGGQNVQTNGSGAYTISGLAPGNYSVTASKTGYSITTNNPNVTLGPDATVNFTAVQVFTISGTVTQNGAGLSGVTVAAGGKNASTNGSGQYTISGLTAGNYNVTASKTGFNINTGTPNVTLGPNATVNFTAVAVFQISGTVTENGAGLSGVTVSAGNQNVMTNGSGQYAITGLAAGNYSVTASKPGYTIGTSNGNGNVTLGPDAVVNFTAVKVFTISGTVKENGTALAGVTVSANGQQATTNLAGFYFIPGLVAGTYNVTASKSGYTITTGTPSVTVGPDQTVDFSAVLTTYSISGTIKVGQNGLVGVVVSVPGHNTTTDNAGNYTLAGLLPGDYTVSASLAEYTFNSDNATVTLGPDATVDFTATRLTYAISGTVKEGSLGVGGVTVSAGGQSTTTNANGTYTLTGLTSGTYTVTPSLSGFTILTPTSRQVTLGPNASGVNFTGTSLPVVVSYQINSNPIRGKKTVKGTVTLNKAMPASGKVLITSNSAVIKVTGGGAAIKKGKTSGAFTFKTAKVTAATPVTLTFKLNNVSVVAQVTVQP